MYVLFDVPIKFENSLVSLPALVADGFFVEVFGAKWLKAVGAFLDVFQFELLLTLKG